MTHTAHTWKQVGGLFEEAMDRPASQRSSFLLDRSASPELIHEVHRLLQLEKQAGEFLRERALILPVR